MSRILCQRGKAWASGQGCTSSTTGMYYWKPDMTLQGTIHAQWSRLKKISSIKCGEVHTVRYREWWCSVVRLAGMWSSQELLFPHVILINPIDLSEYSSPQLKSTISEGKKSGKSVNFKVALLYNLAVAVFQGSVLSIFSYLGFLTASATPLTSSFFICISSLNLHLEYQGTHTPHFLRASHSIMASSTAFLSDPLTVQKKMVQNLNYFRFSPRKFVFLFMFP